MLPASRYFVAILNIALRNWNTYYTLNELLFIEMYVLY